MELDITDFFENSTASDYAASAAELGPDAGRITWRNAAKDSPRFMLLDTDDKADAAREFFAGFGAWDHGELAAMPCEELNALLLQFIAGDIREFMELTDGDWKEYERLCSEGTCQGRMYEGTDGRAYYYMGN